MQSACTKVPITINPHGARSPGHLDRPATREMPHLPALDWNLVNQVIPLMAL